MTLISASPLQIKNPSLNLYQIIGQLNIPRTSEFATSETSEFLIDNNIFFVPARGNQESPSVAFDGINYLVVWKDYRSEDFYPDVYATRVNQAGEILDSSGIIIASTTQSYESPAVAFDGTNFLVVWSDFRNHSDCNIYATRVTRDGILLDRNGFAISTAEKDQTLPSVAFDGTNYFVIWESWGNSHENSDMYGVRVTINCQVLDSKEILISNAQGRQLFPTVAFDGLNYLVVWEDERNYPDKDIYAARVSQNGKVLDTNGISLSISSNQQSPSVAFDGTNYLVVWAEYRNQQGSLWDILGTRINREGIVLDSSGIIIANSQHIEDYPCVAFDGINYLVAWEDWRNYPEADIYGVRLNRTGNIIDSTPIAISVDSGQQYLPKAVFGNTNYLIVWQDTRKGDGDIYGARVTQTGVLIDSVGKDVSIMVNEQSSPSVAFDGNNYLVVWSDWRNRSWDIYATRVNQDGLILDPDCIPISTAPGDQLSPSVIFDGTNYFVVWEDKRNGSSDIYGSRVSKNGEVLEPNGIIISNAEDSQLSPSVAFDSINYLVVWTDYRNYEWYFFSSDIYCARISKTGVVVDPDGIIVSKSSGFFDTRISPSVAFDGNDYLVLWQGRYLGPYDIYGTQVTQAGIVLPSNILISKAADWQGPPSIIFDGSNYMSVWTDYRKKRESGYDISGAKISKTDNSFSSKFINISTNKREQRNPSVVFDGKGYFVVWEEKWSIFNEYDIFGARMNLDGQVIDSFAVSVQPGDQYTPVLAKGFGNQVIIVYSGITYKYQGRNYYNTQRIWSKIYPFTRIIKDRLVDIYPNPVSSYFILRFLHDPQEINLKIYDVTGRLKISEKRKVTGAEVKIIPQGIVPGVYILKIKVASEEFTGKLVVK